MSEQKDKVSRLNPIARVLLQGLYDEESNLHMLRGFHYILKAIWDNIVDYWKSRIKAKPHNQFVDNIFEVNFIKARTDSTYGSPLIVKFPKPEDININMMPFIMGRDFKETKLPKLLKSYWDNIITHCITHNELGKIGYLTVQESFVKEGLSQRRPGIHTESPGVCMLKDSEGYLLHRYLYWGGGHFQYSGDVGDISMHLLRLEGGIYMASNVENSCRLWNCQILRPEVDSPDVVGEHGDIEHLREFLPSTSEVMDANTVYWMTDRTPHESLPLNKGTKRQFFRLVTSLVSVWFEDHSTKNPNGVVPDPKLTKIVKGSKFDGNCSVVDSCSAESTIDK